MKSCVVTANYACDPNKVWLYLTKPTLNNWRKDVSGYEESDDGMKATEKNTDGGETQIVFTRKEKPRCLSCNFQKGKISGTFTALLLDAAFGPEKQKALSPARLALLLGCGVLLAPGKLVYLPLAALLLVVPAARLGHHAKAKKCFMDIVKKALPIGYI